MTNPFKWIMNIIHQRKRKKIIAAKLKKLEEQDPFIYD